MWTYQLASIKIPVKRYLNNLCAKIHNFIQKCTPNYLRAPTTGFCPRMTTLADQGMYDNVRHVSEAEHIVQSVLEWKWFHILYFSKPFENERTRKSTWWAVFNAWHSLFLFTNKMYARTLIGADISYPGQREVNISCLMAFGQPHLSMGRSNTLAYDPALICGSNNGNSLMQGPFWNADRELPPLDQRQCNVRRRCSGVDPAALVPGALYDPRGWPAQHSSLQITNTCRDVSIWTGNGGGHGSYTYSGNFRGWNSELYKAFSMLRCWNSPFLTLKPLN